jgi:hypothetical protein
MSLPITDVLRPATLPFQTHYTTKLKKCQIGNFALFVPFSAPVLYPLLKPCPLMLKTPLFLAALFTLQFFLSLRSVIAHGLPHFPHVGNSFPIMLSVYLPSAMGINQESHPNTNKEWLDV